ncbi:hypothetical protein ACIRPK_22765 [Kitasatospora sp. NPDC101801]|uniref:hypothetical protein n=1 Tax=Kitasatospora sp. NPDC101801 TaxID=3364103 RepID=UPI00380C7D82
MNGTDDDLDKKVRFLWSLASSDLHTRPWHDATTPPAAQAAWQEFETARDKATDIVESFSLIRTEARRAERERRAEHRTHADGGPKPKGVFKPADITGRRHDAALAIQAALENMQTLRSRYERLESDRAILIEWRGTLISRVDGTQEKAQTAINAAESAFAEWTGTSDTLARITAKLGLSGMADGGTPIISSGHSKIFREAWEAFPKLAQAVGTNDVVASGRWATMTEKELTAVPSLWQREILSYNRIGSEDRARLLRIELAERRRGEVISSFEIPADMTAEQARNVLSRRDL